MPLFLNVAVSDNATEKRRMGPPSIMRPTRDRRRPRGRQRGKEVLRSQTVVASSIKPQARDTLKE